ncbi:hypothetical protein F0U61_05290 [Archangium violaceum]|uniref:H-type lectin domain-containing protein n=1 Tax=Archangium violaceum TaxID=83451 RepID=UPI002B317580|nr:hypothetical protein F0U61_05290 [Archangium violaceum]
MPPKRILSILYVLLLALPLAARAQTSPRAVSIRIQCELREVSQTGATSVRDCQSLFGWFEGRLDWRSGGTVGDDASGTLLYSELGRFYATHSFDGEVLVYADGNGVSEDFQQRYLTPSEHNVLTAPDVRVVLYARKRDDYVLLTDQRFMPVASAVWARYAEEAMRFSGELRGDVQGPQEGTRVVGLQNVPVSESAPSLGQQLRFDGSQWAPSSLTGSDVPGGSGHYIQNQDGAPQDARFSISGTASVGALQVGGGTTLQRLQMGTFVLNPPGRCGGYPVVKCNYTYSFWFPKTFSSPPTVLASPRSECWDCSDTFNVTVRSVTNRGFDIVVTRTDPNRAGGDWGQSLRIDFLAGN